MYIKEYEKEWEIALNRFLMLASGAIIVIAPFLRPIHSVIITPPQPFMFDQNTMRKGSNTSNNSDAGQPRERCVTPSSY